MPKSSSLKENSIVIHPSSNYVRIGRSTDFEPLIIPHCISRRRKNHTIFKQSIISDNRISTASNPKFNNAIKLTSIAMKSATIEQLEPYREQPTILEISQMNKGNLNVTLTEYPSKFKTEFTEEFYVGEDACTLPPNAPYNMYWPYWGEKLTERYSQSAALQDLEDIWTCTLERQLGIGRSDLPQMSVILVIPDIVVRREVRWMVDLLLTRMQLGAVILQQENVCVTYGTGLPTACVVSLHETCVSVSCVEEGVSIPEGRIKLLHGTGDVLCLFHCLLQRVGLPRTLLDDYSDWETVSLLQRLYNSACSATPEPDSRTILLQASRRTFEDSNSGGDIRQPQLQSFEIRIATEHLLAGLSLFQPANLVCKDGPRLVLQHNQAEESEPDDPFDDLYLSLTSRDRKKQRLDESGTNGGPGGPAANGDDADDGDNELPQDSKAARISSLIQESPGSIGKLQSESGKRPLSLHEVIVKCIRRSLGSSLVLPDDVGETGSQLCNVIIAGGGHWSVTNFPGWESWLRQSLEEGGLAQCGEVDVILANSTAGDAIRAGNGCQGDRDSEHSNSAAWKGACMITMAASADDVVITARDWRKYGSRTIREKAPFLW